MKKLSQLCPVQVLLLPTSEIKQRLVSCSYTSPHPMPQPVPHPRGCAGVQQQRVKGRLECKVKCTCMRGMQLQSRDGSTMAPPPLHDMLEVRANKRLLETGESNSSSQLIPALLVLCHHVLQTGKIGAREKVSKINKREKNTVADRKGNTN